MKKLILLASVCFGMLLSGCMENTYQNNKNKTTDNGTTTTTTTQTENSFQSANGKFTIDFPEPPAGPVSRIEKNKAGLMQIFTYTLSVSDNASYFAFYKDYPVGVITDSNTETLLKKEADTFMKNLGTSVEKSTEERLNGNKGLSFSGTLYDTIAVNMRAYFVGKRYYQIGTISANSEISEKQSKHFINSFDIVK